MAVTIPSPESIRINGQEALTRLHQVQGNMTLLSPTQLYDLAVDAKYNANIIPDRTTVQILDAVKANTPVSKAEMLALQKEIEIARKTTGEPSWVNTKGKNPFAADETSYLKNRTPAEIGNITTNGEKALAHLHKTNGSLSQLSADELYDIGTYAKNRANVSTVSTARTSTQVLDAINSGAQVTKAEMAALQSDVAVARKAIGKPAFVQPFPHLADERTFAAQENYLAQQAEKQVIKTSISEAALANVRKAMVSAYKLAEGSPMTTALLAPVVVEILHHHIASEPTAAEQLADKLMKAYAIDHEKNLNNVFLPTPVADGQSGYVPLIEH